MPSDGPHEQYLTWACMVNGTSTREACSGHLKCCVNTGAFGHGCRGVTPAPLVKTVGDGDRGASRSGTGKGDSGAGAMGTRMYSGGGGGAGAVTTSCVHAVPVAQTALLCWASLTLRFQTRKWRQQHGSMFLNASRVFDPRMPDHLHKHPSFVRTSSAHRSQMYHPDECEGSPASETTAGAGVPQAQEPALEPPRLRNNCVSEARLPCQTCDLLATHIRSSCAAPAPDAAAAPADAAAAPPVEAAARSSSQPAAPPRSADARPGPSSEATQACRPAHASVLTIEQACARFTGKFPVRCWCQHPWRSQPYCKAVSQVANATSGCCLMLMQLGHVGSGWMS